MPATTGAANVVVQGRRIEDASMVGQSEMQGRDSVAIEKGAVTFDALFRRNVERSPMAPALVDPPGKNRIVGKPPRAMTYAEVDAAVARLARAFIEMGLPVGCAVGYQLPNTIESVILPLALDRAGLIAAPMPLLWRGADLSAALALCSARAFVTFGVIDGFDHASLALSVAADLFSIRYVCAFGPDLPDGVVPLDDFLDKPGQEVSKILREAAPEGSPAVVTFDMTADGLRAIERNHRQTITGTLAVALACGLPQGSIMLSLMMTSSFSGFCSAIGGWLVSGGTLLLHHPFDEAKLMRQLTVSGADTLIVPAALALGFADLRPRPAKLDRILAVWRAPDEWASRDHRVESSSAISDLLAFGEIAHIVLRRGSKAVVGRLPAGVINAQRIAGCGEIGLELRVSTHGTLMVRGAMVPPGALSQPSGLGKASRADHGFADTGFAARHDRASDTIKISGPPAGVSSVGGYRFHGTTLDKLAATAGAEALLTALPHRMTGQRLAGRAPDQAAAVRALDAFGANALVVSAFAERKSGRLMP